MLEKGIHAENRALSGTRIEVKLTIIARAFNVNKSDLPDEELPENRTRCQQIAWNNNR